MQILIRCTRPQALAARLFDGDQLVEAKVHADGGGLIVKTRNPDEFYLALNRLAADVQVETVTPVDDDVNSLYEYLITGEEVAQ